MSTVIYPKWVCTGPSRKIQLDWSYLFLLASLSEDFEEEDKSYDIELTATLRRPQIKQYTCLTDDEGGGGALQNQREHHIISTKYEAVHPTDVSENNSSPGMLISLTKSLQFEIFQLRSRRALKQCQISTLKQRQISTSKQRQISKFLTLKHRQISTLIHWFIKKIECLFNVEVWRCFNLYLSTGKLLKFTREVHVKR